MEIYNEEKSIEYHQKKDDEKKKYVPTKKEMAMEFGLKKLGNISYSINSYREIDDNLIGRYRLDDIAEKCHRLAKLIRNHPESYIEEGLDMQDVIGNFELKMLSLPHINKSRKSEEILMPTFKKSIAEFDNYLDEQLIKNEEKYTIN